MDGKVEMMPLHNESGRKSNSIEITRWKFWIFALIAVIFGLVIGLLIGFIRKLPDKNQDNYNDISDILLNNLKPMNIRSNLRTLTESVHIAGTEQEEVTLVNFISDAWKNHLDHVEIHTYNILLSYPNETAPNYVSMINENGEMYDKTPVKEPSLTEDEKFLDVGNYFNAFGAAGHVQGQLVFVNFGRLEDFTKLVELNVNVSGKICISKYGKIFRGDKAKYAEANGCIGLIIYTDPADYGNPSNYNEGYPSSWWMPSSGIQRGSLYIQDGDPLTQGYPALKYMYRNPENTTALPKIPVQPVSFEYAYKYLSKLGGNVAPDEWQGGLNITYYLGGEFLPEFINQSITIFSGNIRVQRDVRNVIGYIYGSQEKDRYVIVGNHRDAWVYGTLDPSSGTAVMMEMARSMGDVVKDKKWRPRRSILFCSWGAEEHGLMGSFEWVENYQHKLMRNAVAYFNVDIAVQGNVTLRAKSTPNIKKVLYDIAKKVPNPSESEIAEGRKTVFDTWTYRYTDNDKPDLPFIGNLGSGSDYTAFLQKIGVSSVDFRYTYDEVKTKKSSYPIYHSAHETIPYFEKFVDSDYKFSLAVGQVWTEMARRFSDDVLLPFDCVEYGNALYKLANATIEKNIEDFKKNKVDYNGLSVSVIEFQKACKNFNTSIDTNDILATRELNDKLMYLDRGFIDFNGLPGRNYFRHVIFAPSSTNSYGSSGFPGISDTVYEAQLNGNWEPVKKQVAIVQFYISAAANIFNEGLPAHE